MVLSMASVDRKPRTIFRLLVHTFLVIFFHRNISVFNQRLHTEMYVYTRYIPFILLLIVPIEILHTHTYPIDPSFLSQMCLPSAYAPVHCSRKGQLKHSFPSNLKARSAYSLNMRTKQRWMLRWWNGQQRRDHQTVQFWIAELVT